MIQNILLSTNLGGILILLLMKSWEISEYRKLRRKPYEEMKFTIGKPISDKKLKLEEQPLTKIWGKNVKLTKTQKTEKPTKTSTTGSTTITPKTYKVPKSPKNEVSKSAKKRS